MAEHLVKPRWLNGSPIRPRVLPQGTLAVSLLPAQSQLKDRTWKKVRVPLTFILNPSEDSDHYYLQFQSAKHSMSMLCTERFWSSKAPADIYVAQELAYRRGATEVPEHLKTWFCFSGDFLFLGLTKVPFGEYLLFFPGFLSKSKKTLPQPVGFLEIWSPLASVLPADFKELTSNLHRRMGRSWGMLEIANRKTFLPWFCLR